MITETNEDVREPVESHTLSDYNEAYYRWVYCLKKEKDQTKAILDKMRHIWFIL